MAGKISQLDVNYRRSWNLARRCGTCRMIRKRRGLSGYYCTLVASTPKPIRTSGVCDRWEPKP